MLYVPIKNSFDIFNFNDFVIFALNQNNFGDIVIKKVNDSNNNINANKCFTCNKDATESNCNPNKWSEPSSIFCIKPKDIFNFSAELEKTIEKFHLKHLGEQIRIHFNDIAVFSEGLQSNRDSISHFCTSSKKQFLLVLKELFLIYLT